MAHRNRWFTVLNSMVDLSMAIAVSHNQMVILPVVSIEYSLSEDTTFTIAGDWRLTLP